ncbi:hypothetical protein BH23THE1_BH23THE1_34360 [soil metagenome]
MLSELENLTNQQRYMLTFFQWYSKLKQELQNKYNIIIEEEFEYFAKAINDFKNYNYDIHLILKEYREIESLRQEIGSIQHTVNIHLPLKDNLLNEVSRLNDQISYSKQTMDTYYQLYKSGFGLKELKQLSSTIMEISLANNIRMHEAVSKFLKNVEDQYDNKLGFEKKINELKARMEELKDQVPEYQSYLKLQGIVSPTLIHLSNSGVTNEDIIGMNHLVLEFKNSDFLSDPINKSDYNSNTKTNDSMIRSQYWNVFVEKLKELKNINSEIYKQASSLDNLKSQISDLITNKQQIENVYADSVSNLNKIITKTHQFLDIARQISESTSKKILPIPILVPVLVDFDSPHDNDPDDTQDC